MNKKSLILIFGLIVLVVLATGIGFIIGKNYGSKFTNDNRVLSGPPELVFESLI